MCRVVSGYFSVMVVGDILSCIPGCHSDIICSLYTLRSESDRDV